MIKYRNARKHVNTSPNYGRMPMEWGFRQSRTFLWCIKQSRQTHYIILISMIMLSKRLTQANYALLTLANAQFLDYQPILLLFSSHIAKMGHT
ncbi:hypothetical protein BOO23_04630 [Vibrio navarrensis]|nr:hypothetical protein [Vibrio navarrensis]